MAGNPQNNDLFLDLDDQGLNYGNPGRLPATSEEDYAHWMSITFDEIVEGTGDHRTFTQTSALDSYQPYYDDLHGVGRSTTD